MVMMCIYELCKPHLCLTTYEISAETLLFKTMNEYYAFMLLIKILIFFILYVRPSNPFVHTFKCKHAHYMLMYIYERDVAVIYGKHDYETSKATQTGNIAYDQGER